MKRSKKKRNLKKILSLLLMLAVLAAMSGCGTSTADQNGEAEEVTTADADEMESSEDTTDDTYVASQTTVLKISNGLSEDHPIIQAAYYFEELIEEALPDRFDVQIYPNASLGDDSAATQDVAMGNLEGVLTPTSPVVSIVPELGVFDLPFLVPNTDAADELLDYITPVMQEKFEGTGLKLITSLELGFRDLTNSKRTVVTPDDLAGIKVRVMDNAMHLDMWQSLGATPTVMAWSELFTAMQQHTVDGQENPISVIYASGFQEVQDYLTLTEHIYAPYLFFVSEEIWDSMTEYEQEVFVDCAEQMSEYEITLVRETNESWVSELKDSGMEITELTSEQKQEWYDKCVHIYDDYSEQIGAEFVREIQEMMDAYR